MPRRTSPLPLLLLVLAPFALGACSADTATLDPLRWQKVPGTDAALNGAILGTGPTGHFDEKANFTVMAFRDGDKIRLYYGGGDATGACAGINGSHWRIGVATSTDGVTFERYAGSETGGAILDNGGLTTFDTQLTYRPYVLKDGARYRMWFNGSTHAFNCPAGELALDRKIGYAESDDGLTWHKVLGPEPDGSVLPLGPPGAIDAQQVGYVWVIKDTTEYKMYYSANDATNTWRVALAVSSDGLTWTKKPGKQRGGAILDIGPSTAFDAACAYQPTVYKEKDQLYRMWYRGCQAGVTTGPSHGTIGYAESNDGITWVKIPQPTPAGDALGRGDPPAFDDNGLTTPSVFVDGAEWQMYYAGFDLNGQFLTGLARAPR